MDFADELDYPDMDYEQTDNSPHGTLSSYPSPETPSLHMEQEASEIAELLDEYRLHCSEDISKSPEAVESENHPSWLLDHLDSMKETLEKELIDLQDNLNDPFELDYDEISHEKEMEEIRKIEAKAENENKRANLEETPIYPGSRLTVGISALLVIAVVLRHSLTGQALNDILKLVWLHCLGSGETLRSINALKKCFCDFSSPLTFHWYCSNCFMLVDKNNEKVCPNSFCGKDFSVSGSLSFFVEVPIFVQLQKLFSKEGFYHDIQYRHHRQRESDQICDIYDGELYKKLSQYPYVLSSPHNISFTWNTDGVPVFKSSNFSLWPLYLVVNELPPKKRFSKDNMILAGLWFGSSKPAMWMYLKPFHSALSRLERNGTVVESPDCPGTFNVRAVLLCGTCDLPAKACVCNTMQYNGSFGCFKCLQPGCTVKVGNRGGHVHAFPFNMENVKGPPRTNEQCINDAKEAITQGKAIRGIKGPCWFAGLEYYDLIKGTAIDYMHCVLEGVTKSLLNLWFSPSYKMEPFNISTRIQEVDGRLCQIKPPNDITRCPRKIEKEVQYWKASEYRSFLLFYGPIVLREILPTAYYTHFIFLSEAIFILLGDSITNSELVHAERLLQHFCLMFSALYTKGKETINIHSLLHLTDDVRNLGPLWTHSCFPFESYNGNLLKLFHGSQNVELQIVSAIAITQSLPSLKSKLIPGSTEEEFFNSLTSPVHSSKEQIIERNIYALGSPQFKRLSPQQLTALGQHLGEVPLLDVVPCFKRVRMRGSVFHSLSYTRVTARNSYTVLCQDRHCNDLLIGHVDFYFQYQIPCTNSLSCKDNCVCPVHNLALIRPFTKVPDFKLVEDSLTHSTGIQITAVSSKHERLEVLPISAIKEKLVYMLFKDEDIAFACRFPNRVESD